MKSIFITAQQNPPFVLDFAASLVSSLLVSSAVGDGKGFPQNTELADVTVNCSTESQGLEMDSSYIV